MTDNLPMLIPRSRNKNGYVYIAKINKCYEDTEGCYKIGSTRNVDRRMQRLSDDTIATVDLVAYGYSNARLTTEKFLQALLKSNYWYKYGDNKRRQFWWSTEHFNFNESEVRIAINMLDLISASCIVFDGSEE